MESIEMTLQARGDGGWNLLHSDLKLSLMNWLEKRKNCFTDRRKAIPFHQLSRVLSTFSSVRMVVHSDVTPFLVRMEFHFIVILRWKIYLSEHVSAESCLYRQVTSLYLLLLFFSEPLLVFWCTGLLTQSFCEFLYNLLAHSFVL